MENLLKIYDIKEEELSELKALTPARICVGRAGTRLKTNTFLKFRADHAVAMDAVWSSVDEKLIDTLNFLKVQTLAKDKEEYITRPDLGRKFSEETLDYIKNNCINEPDVQIIAGDGLSATAINANLRKIYFVIVEKLKSRGYKVGTPIFVKYARVATMDKISEELNAKVTIILIGERPGLATGESMSSYMAYESSTKKPESQRTVVSNIHNKGIPSVDAGKEIVRIIDIMMKEKKSGVELRI
ncbi:ethanolamine ammonia-lyase small subunit [Clostridium acetobutylicum]|uniref:Ethanolamine ammonia-lyase small subunit n=1 Tax=Clostridium acetobutylicum (strain ATCC 824 / DSM 792 / JCM 1419 / IAM 19013 / LMG 5710 / NBRC 13948 / NRRL B-527 / VKM B-1787 / 2291 / W) TaxID=272562 RepID=EUTC_CLOAB|nr:MULTISPECIES: ethanolamine ammonia-lyase subunit EutC [Clostridium]Q97FL9.1 RecName: Full=Ethanolamine ammonia-lyase small subunit; Short=EAL small subunit [Clostridium acetobutylicum ATCC 824]AAK80663.1 Ethanolamine ammonia lyase small subunit [Clostridium acetobutylicum ATCC 824]ADZ21763.1 ethanolamine ammonia-lyase small subunit [Clostridium acetobutylicum EA 2018]AEI33359.1 ethanolamine ammonia-lyase small subunit [Clostridium acetobutylicum DSM 1731]AWV78923.1 ethanolamine ammonia-lyas